MNLPGPDSGTRFLGMNLLCSPGFPWQDAPDSLKDQTTVNGQQVAVEYPVNCADSQVERIPYYAFVLLMFGTTYYQQRQTQNAQPAGAVDPRQQSPARLMPLMFGVFGFLPRADWSCTGRPRMPGDRPTALHAQEPPHRRAARRTRS